MMKVLLADDHPASLAGVRYELSHLPTIEIVGTARNSTEIVEWISRKTCDILVTDYAMPGGEYGDGLSLLSFLRRRYPQLHIIVFTMLDNPAVAKEMTRLGVQAVVNKADDLSHLVFAVQAGCTGAPYWSPTSLASYKKPGAPEARIVKELTKREAEVVRLYVSGKSVKEIAEQLHRSKQTVSSQKVAAMRKIGIARDADLFRYAFETGLVSSVEPRG